MDFTFDPGAAAALVVAEALYVRAWRVLGARGYEIPRGQLVAWHAGVLAMAGGPAVAHRRARATSCCWPTWAST